MVQEAAAQVQLGAAHLLGVEVLVAAEAGARILRSMLGILEGIGLLASEKFKVWKKDTISLLCFVQCVWRSGVLGHISEAHLT